MTTGSTDPIIETIGLVCLDFDGTAITYDREPGVLHPEIIDWLNRLGRAGVAWVANSGRDLQDQHTIARLSTEEGLAFMPEAILCSESLIFHRQNGDYLPQEPWNTDARRTHLAFHRLLQEELAEELRALVEQYAPVQTVVHEEATAFCVDEEGGAADRFYGDFTRCVARVSDGWVTRNGGWFAALPRSLGKGHILRAYLAASDRPREATLCVGDHLNDLPMLDGSVTPHVACPANAHGSVREAVGAVGGYVATREGPLGTVAAFAHFFGDPGEEGAT